MRAALSFILLLTASPAFAAGTAIPEPSSAALLALGVGGLIVGRQAAKRRRRD